MRDIEAIGVNSSSPAAKQPWTAPAVRELPRLTELTLQSFIPGTGIPGGGGSTVF